MSVVGIGFCNRYLVSFELLFLDVVPKISYGPVLLYVDQNLQRSTEIKEICPYGCHELTKSKAHYIAHLTIQGFSSKTLDRHKF